MQTLKLFHRKRHRRLVAFGAILLVSGWLGHHFWTQQAPQSFAGPDMMLDVFRAAAAEGQKRFLESSSSLHSGVDYVNLPSAPSKNALGISSTLERVLNRHKAFISHRARPMKSEPTKREFENAQNLHRYWVSLFLRPELLPSSNQWSTSFYLAPNGDEVAASAWKSNGFSIRVCEGRNLCIVVKPDRSRDLFGHTLPQILEARKGKDSSRIIDPLPVPYTLSQYAFQVYALVGLDPVTNNTFSGIQQECEYSMSRIEQGRLFMDKGNESLGRESLPRTFVRDIRYWTDGITVVFVVDKLVIQASPDKQQPSEQLKPVDHIIGGLEETDRRTFKFFGATRFQPKQEAHRYRKELRIVKIS